MTKTMQYMGPDSTTQARAKVSDVTERIGKEKSVLCNSKAPLLLR